MGDPGFKTPPPSLAKAAGRRAVLRALGAAGSALLAALGLAGGDAKKKGKKKGRKKRKKQRPPSNRPGWTPQTTFGTSGSGPSEFILPARIAASADGQIAWIADAGNRRISVWRRSSPTSGDWTNWTTFGSPGSQANQFGLPLGVFVFADHLTVWVADNSSNRISVWTRPGIDSTAWTNQTTFGALGDGPDQFFGPIDVHLSGDGLTAWVADFRNHRVSVWRRSSGTSTDWTNWTTFGGEGSGVSQFNGPTGIFVSDDGLTAYVADQANHRISVWRRSSATETDWANWTSFGTKGSGSEEFTEPYDVAVAEDGLTAWVSDRLNHRVSIWTRPSSSSTDWSNADAFGSVGIFGSHQFRHPLGIANIGGETLIVADSENRRIAVWILCKNPIGLCCPPCDIELVLSGGPNIATPVFIDDDLLVELNGQTIFSNTDGVAGDVGPIVFRAQPGDELRVFATNVVAPCITLSPLYLRRTTGEPPQVLDPVGVPGSCSDHGPGVIYDETFTIA